jgi:hypothetical protein
MTILDYTQQVCIDVCMVRGKCFEIAAFRSKTAVPGYISRFQVTFCTHTVWIGMSGSSIEARPSLKIPRAGPEACTWFVLQKQSYSTRCRDHPQGLVSLPAAHAEACSFLIAS